MVISSEVVGVRMSLGEVGLEEGTAETAPGDIMADWLLGEAASDRCSTDFFRGEYLLLARLEGVASASSRYSLRLAVSRALGDRVGMMLRPLCCFGMVPLAAFRGVFFRGETWLMGELTLETGLLMGEDMVERTEEMAEESSSKVKFRGEAGRTMVAAVLRYRNAAAGYLIKLL